MLHKPPRAPNANIFATFVLARSSYSKTPRGSSCIENFTENWKTPTQRGAQDKINGLFLRASCLFPFPILLLRGDSILIVVFALCFGLAVQHTNNKRITGRGNILKHNKRRQKRPVQISRFFQNIYICMYVCMFVSHRAGLLGVFSVSVTPIWVIFMPTLWHKGLQIETIILRVCSKNVYGNFQGICQTWRCLWFLQPETVK